MNKLYKTVMIAGICCGIIFMSGCGYIPFKSVHQKNQVTETVRTYETISFHYPTKYTKIRAVLSGSAYVIDNDDIDSVDVVYSPDDDSYYMRLDLNKSGIEKFEEYRSDGTPKEITVRAGSEQVFAPPVFGEYKDGTIIISGIGDYDAVYSAAQKMTKSRSQATEEESQTDTDNDIDESKKPDVDMNEDDDSDRKTSPAKPDEEKYDNSSDEPQPKPDGKSIETELIYRVRKSADDAKSQIGAFENIQYAVRLADERMSEGYEVYDQFGNLIYSPN